MTRVKTTTEIEHMRTSGGMLAQVLNFLKPHVQPGISTKDLANLAASELKKLGGKPAFLGYYNFPDVLCTSINDEVVHGIPSRDKKLNLGDVIGLDFGVNYQGMITDGAISVIAGNTGDQRVHDLIKYTQESLIAGIGTLRNGVQVGDIANAVQNVLDKKHFGIVRDLVGHGVGHQLHEDPNIPNYGKKGTGPKLLAGMTIAIEPMATLGGYDVYTDNDSWTIRTRDGSVAAHFEHTVLIKENGFEILTQA